MWGGVYRLEIQIIRFVLYIGSSLCCKCDEKRCGKTHDSDAEKKRIGGERERENQLTQKSLDRESRLRGSPQCTNSVGVCFDVARVNAF